MPASIHKDLDDPTKTDLDATLFATSSSGLGSFNNPDTKPSADLPGSSQEDLREQLANMQAANQELLALNQNLLARGGGPSVSAPDQKVSILQAQLSKMEEANRHMLDVNTHLAAKLAASPSPADPMAEPAVLEALDRMTWRLNELDLEVKRSTTVPGLVPTPAPPQPLCWPRLCPWLPQRLFQQFLLFAL